MTPLRCGRSKRRLLDAASLGAIVAFAMMLGPVACSSDRQASNTDLRLAVAGAREKGQSTAKLERISDGGGGRGLAFDEVARTRLFILLEAKRPAVAITTTSSIETWNLFAERRRAVELQAADPTPCRFLPPSDLQYGGTDFLLPLISTGTVRVEGITVTATSADSDVNLESGRQYLTLAKECAPHIGRLSFGAFGVFPVDDGGRVSAMPKAFSGGTRPYFDEILRLGTIDSIFQAVQAARSRPAGKPAGGRTSER